VYHNERYVAEEAAHWRWLGELYSRSSFGPASPTGARQPSSSAPGVDPAPPQATAIREGENPGTNLGRWDGRHAALERIEPYGDSESYRIGAEYLRDCVTVEDWGCGKGWFSKFRTHGYVGIDGSRSPFASQVADLVEYSSSVDGIFMRHVLEHNYDWKRILHNALRSFRSRMVLVIYTPWSTGETKEIVFIERVGVPEISFNRDDIVVFLAALEWELVELASPATIYGQEHLFLIRRSAGKERVPL
jgi:hypothetical protein